MIKKNDPPGAVLSIAGSDPSGGAGIQADLKTFCVAGVYGGAVITCHTVQNTRGVNSFQPVDPVLVREQIRMVLADLPVSHIKIGMIGSTGIAAALHDELKDFPGEIIYDPVLVSSGGTPLMAGLDAPFLKKQVAGLATVMTPNLPELEFLSNRKCGSPGDIFQAAAGLFPALARLRTVIVTGGHFAENENVVVDTMLTRGGVTGEVITRQEEHRRHRTRNTHGTGCTFSSAFTAFHLMAGEDYQAFRQAVAFMDRLLEKSCDFQMGSGNGPLPHHLLK